MGSADLWLLTKISGGEKPREHFQCSYRGLKMRITRITASEIMTDNKQQFDWKKPDRRLGEQWADWSGDLDQEQSPASGRVYFYVSLLVFVLVVGVLALGLYMTWPRLLGFHSLLPVVLGWFFAVILVLGVLWFLLVALVARNGRIKAPGRKGTFLFLRWLFDRGLGLARRLGMHRDRYGHSFVRFSNRLTRSGGMKTPRKLLVLLPRCLRPECRQELEALGEEKGFDVFMATGGGAARQIIFEVKPQAIVAVACERDLVSGIKDVAPHLPVLAVSNVRPEGPCKSTTVDMKLVREYIDFFIGDGHGGTAN